MELLTLPVLIPVLVGIAVLVAVVGWVLTRKRLPPLPPSDPPSLTSPDAVAKPSLPMLDKAGEGAADEPSVAPLQGEPAETSPVAASEAAVTQPQEAGEPAKGIFARLKAGLSRTQKQLSEQLDAVLLGKKEIDDEVLEELEMALISADMGVRTVTGLLDSIRDDSSRTELADPVVLKKRLSDSILTILQSRDPKLAPIGDRPYVIMVVGVNGAGKTTTIGKLATRFTNDGHKVLLAAGDTFRAAAIEQLEVWGDRAGVPVVKRDEGSDPSSVIYDALERAKAEDYDIVIADTAGRLHTKVNLMEELKKIHRVIGKVVPGAPHETLLVLDATTGQNAVHQARSFNEGVSLTGLVLTKLDGTAKGGIVVQVINELDIPVKLIGVGEGIDDLRDFDPTAFVDALL